MCNSKYSDVYQFIKVYFAGYSSIVAQKKYVIFEIIEYKWLLM